MTYTTSQEGISVRSSHTSVKALTSLDPNPQTIETDIPPDIPPPALEVNTSTG